MLGHFFPQRSLGNTDLRDDKTLVQTLTLVCFPIWGNQRHLFTPDIITSQNRTERQTNMDRRADLKNIQEVQNAGKNDNLKQAVCLHRRNWEYSLATLSMNNSHYRVSDYSAYFQLSYSPR